MCQRQIASEVMSEKQNQGSIFYTYSQFERSLLQDIRRETYGQDIGQFSWITADELRKFFRQLDLQKNSRILDVACGSGGPALFTAETIGCHVTGVDINENGINTANRIAKARDLQARVCFERIDARQPLSFPDESFEAILSIDAMNHFSNRIEVLAEWRRVLQPGGCFLFTDAVVVTGTLSRDEILARSNSMGLFLFTPVGAHERLIEAAGFIDLQVEDVTETIAAIAKRWHDARDKHQPELLEIESQADFDNLQNMLAAAHTLASEHRLSRFAYSARKLLQHKEQEP